MSELGPEVMRDVERNIYMSIIDQRWREHLAEMDYLQEGIGLRAMGQKDPLVEWQREGFERFAMLVNAIDEDFVRYAMHAEVVIEQPEAPDIRDLQYSAADESAIGGFANLIGQDMGAAFAAQGDGDGDELVTRVPEPEDAPMQPIVKSAIDKIGRNDPCHCGSGKKFKNCHGR